MAAPKTITWEIEPHTKAKHAILERYLQAWIPILGMNRFPQIVYIDGFAGPGRYSNNEHGSPVIALNAALQHHHKSRINAEIRFLFVEDNADRASMLQSILSDFSVPSNIRVRVATGKFESTVGEFMDRLWVENLRPPIFAFIDPFGWSGVPFSSVRRILASPSCEVLVTFMYEEINRFIGHPDQEANFDSFFGTDAWREIISIPVPRERNRKLHDLYMNQLRDSAGAKYVRSFEMRNDNDVTDYYLFYATNNILGLKKMKAAMWKVDSSGEFRFSDATDPNQYVFLIDKPQLESLSAQITERFGGQVPTVGEIEEFVLAETAFRESHYRSLLRQMESTRPPTLEVIDPPLDRRKGSFSEPSLRIRFLPEPRRLF